ncbi:MAG: HD domain-containing protein [Candidatus Omnitrophica bacterium]|nr:HD domain-containing protein [Candidatus Omnitrophota bacterium]
MKKMQMRSFNNSSVVVKFQVFFIVLALLPLAILMYLYYELKVEGRVSLSVEDLNTVLIFVVVGIFAGYMAMRSLLSNLVDVTKTSTGKLREIMGMERIQDLLKGDENEIAILTRTFREVTSRLEDNVTSLQAAKKTLQSVLTRVGHGIANIRSIDSFLDLIVETITEALSGKQGFLLLVDNEKKVLTVKTVFGASLGSFDNKCFSLETSPFSPAIRARTAFIIPKVQYLSSDENRATEGLEFPVICAPLLCHNEVIGVLAVSGRKVEAPFQEEEMVLLLNLAMQTAVAIENSKLSADVGRTYFETLSALAMAVEAKDDYSRGHLDRVGQYSVSIAQYIGLPIAEVGNLRDAARIHDVGKIGILDGVLTKPTTLNDEEWVIMKRHPEIGEGIIRPISSLQPLCDMVRHHHEKLDGSGYPDGLKGDQIPLLVRILAVADIFDALTSDRPYRKAMPQIEAIATLRSLAGKIDQEVVDVLEKIIFPAAPRLS